jgi:hypothetical protein
MGDGEKEREREREREREIVSRRRGRKVTKDMREDPDQMGKGENY